MKKNTLISKGLLAATGAVSILGSGLIANAAELTPVSLELAILIDASDSIPSEHFDAQIHALNNIFNDVNFYNDFIAPLKDDPTLNIHDPSLAVGIFQFGAETFGDRAGDLILEPILDWTLFNEQRQSGIGQLNANKIDGFTPIGDTLGAIIDELSNNDYDGHRVVNLSSDGFETFSSVKLPIATRDAFRSGVTFNVLAIPAIDAQTEINSTAPVENSYDLNTLQSIFDRYPYLPPEHKNNNLAGNPAFIMFDYLLGDKTMEEAFRLKLGLETIGRAPTPRLDVEEPTTDPTDPTAPGTDPTDPTAPGTVPTAPGTDPTVPTAPGTGGDPGTIGEPAAQHIPEPSSLLGLLSVSLLGLLRKKKKA